MFDQEGRRIDQAVINRLARIAEAALELELPLRQAGAGEMTSQRGQLQKLGSMSWTVATNFHVMIECRHASLLAP